MIYHLEISNTELRNKIKEKTIRLGGNCKLKIYGTLQCKSGKRMKRESRVFFQSAEEALLNNYRPCGNCMKSEFKK